MNTYEPELKNSHGQIVMVDPSRIAPSAVNPRTKFDGEKIAELVESFRVHGFTPALSHLLVRGLSYRWWEAAPGVWALAASTGGAWKMLEREQLIAAGFAHGELVTEADCEAALAMLPKWELVCGERRWRASRELKLDEVPVVVEEISDLLALELQLIENLQREGLTPLEEAHGFREMLAFRDAAGEPVYTVKSLAAKLGRTEMSVRNRLSLCRLEGSVAGEAVNAGDLPVAHAYLLARVPAGRLRDDLTRRVLKPADGMAPMPSRQLERLIRDECMVELRGADFDLADASLVPVMRSVNTGERASGGACVDCPFNTKNAEAEGGSKIHMCMNPDCFREKRAAADRRWAESVRDEVKGVSALVGDDAARVFDYSGVRVVWNSGFVELDDVPPEHDLRPGVKDPGTWRKLVRGRGVPVVLARDVAGKVHELVEHKLALAAGQENEREDVSAARVFRGADARAEVEDKDKKESRIASEKEDRERDRRLADAQIAAMVEAAGKSRLPEGFWVLALSSLISVAADVGEDVPVVHRRGLDCKKASPAEALMQYASKLLVADQVGMAVELLLQLYAPAERALVLPKWAKTFAVDLKAVKKAVTAAMAAERAAEAERKSLADGMAWLSMKEGVEDFEWNSAGVCVNPDVARIVLPKSAKVTATVEVARSEKGWVFGVHFEGNKCGSGDPCQSSEVKYSSRALALAAGLKRIKELAKRAGVDAAGMKRIFEYIPLVGSVGLAPREEPKPEKKPKAKHMPRRCAPEPEPEEVKDGPAVADSANGPLADFYVMPEGTSRSIVELLTAAGPEGMKVKDIADKLGIPASNVSVWFSTAGKKLTRKLAAGVYSAFPPESYGKDEKVAESGGEIDEVWAKEDLREAVKIYRSSPRDFCVARVQRHLKLSYQAALKLHDDVVEWLASQKLAGAKGGVL